MSNILDPSIYNIQETVASVAKDYIPEESEDTLAVGIFGYLIDMQSQQIQNDIIVNSELGNELWPARARYKCSTCNYASISRF